MEKEKIKYPMVLADDGKGEMRTVMDGPELASFGGDAERFVAKLRENGALSAGSSSSL